MIDASISLPPTISEAIAYTLLHSVWQGLAVFVLLRTTFLFVHDSRARYTLATIALLVLFCLSAGTFTYLSEGSTDAPVSPGKIAFNAVHYNIDNPTTSWLATVSAIISASRNYIVSIWIIGFVVYATRYAFGHAYLIHLRNSATSPGVHLNASLHAIAERLGMASIDLRESTRISAPIVIGIFKPCILIPAGLASGLSSAQLEAVFLHELYHIRRNDYLINGLQSMVEAVFFFNPFVWMISSDVRREREHCCDDAVVASGGDRRAYAWALASMEERRMNQFPALSLIGNKNELLQRIKRIMEKSVTHHSLREKVIPVVFLVIGLTCASWFSIQKGPDTTADLPAEKHLAADTSIRKTQKSGLYTRKKTTVTGEDGITREHITEEFEGDEDLRVALVPPPMSLDISFPPMPDLEAMAPLMLLDDLHFGNDTIPPFRPIHGDWKAFEEQFTKEFQEHFGTFYQDHQGEFEKMMEEFRRNFEPNQALIEELRTGMAAHHEEMKDHALAMAEQALHLREQSASLEKFSEQMREWEKTHASTLREMEERTRLLEESMRAFQKELTTELIKDGYLKAGEELRDMHWSDDGDILINGQKIRESDEKKYRVLHEKHFENDIDKQE